MTRRSWFPAVLLLLATVPPLNAQEVVVTKEVVVTNDDTLITTSCTVRIPNGRVIADANGNGVLHVRGKDVTVTFAKGSVLLGAPAGTPWDRLTGTGIRILSGSGVRLVNARVHGFKVGIHASGLRGGGIRGCDVSDNFRQQLLSTPDAEIQGDWLSPHDNDQQQWTRAYGAGIYVERSKQVEICRCRARRGQNGIVLDRVEGAAVFDNDCSFLSGWGLALWRSSHNTITRNAFDFCVRGYSHGVYNRGQDSAGILMFEQCSGNVIAENSVTHGGDGIFAFAGQEALGQRKPGAGAEPFSYKRRGNNDNLLLSNDLSYAAAHGLELTFSFGNRVYQNRLVGNAICGIWAGYSQDTEIAENVFEGNGERGYGLERGGINIEHGAGNRIHHNVFRNNRCGVHLWDDADAGLLALPWAKANHRGCLDNVVVQNRFDGDRLVLHLRRAKRTVFGQNQLVRVQKAVEADGGSKTVVPDRLLESRPPACEPRGETRPVGARRQLRGRDKILLDGWGPWDHASPMIRRRIGQGGGDEWQVFGVAGDVEARLVDGPGILVRAGARTATAQAFLVTAPGSGVFPYTVEFTAGGFSRRVGGRILRLDWQLRVFAWQTDPRQDVAAWRRESRRGLSVTRATLDLHYGHGGPRDAGLSEEISARGPGSDRFGTVATSRVKLPEGRYQVTTRSDDGVRVTVNGEKVIENWTHHGPTVDRGTFAVEREREVEILVEHFELDGYAWLSFDLAPAR